MLHHSSLATKLFGVLSGCFLLYFFWKYIWNRRRLYYFASKIQGPIAFPIIGSAYLFIGGTHNILERGLSMCNKYKHLFKIWLGNKLCFVVTKHEDVQIILNSCLEKVPNYKYLIPVFGNGLLILPVSQWKMHRKLIGSTFKQQNINSFLECFKYHADILNEKFKLTLGRGCVNIFPIVAQTTAAILMETTMGVKSDEEDVQNVLLWTTKLAELAVLRMVNPLLHVDFIWRYTSMSKKTEMLSNKVGNFINEIVKAKEQNGINKDSSVKNVLLELSTLSKDDISWNDQMSIDECRTILVAGGDAMALQISFVLMMLGMHQNIQTKTCEELFSVFGSTEREITVEDLQKLTYLELVIKETVRLFPAGAVIGRHLTKDITLTEDRILPKESSVYIPIIYLHRDPEVWNEPLKFDPDRFLPSEIAKRPSYSYLPFSGGPRNCLGSRYALMAMKTILSTILRNYEVMGTEYGKISDIKLKHDVATKCIDGQKVELKRRI